MYAARVNSNHFPEGLLARLHQLCAEQREAPGTDPPGQDPSGTAPGWLDDNDLMERDELAANHPDDYGGNADDGCYLTDAEPADLIRCDPERRHPPADDDPAA